MTQFANSAGDGLLVSRSAANEEFSRALRLYVGRGRRFTAKEAERGSGVPARMVEAYLAGPGHAEWRNPKLGEIVSLTRFLGPDFTSVWLQLADQGAFWLPETDDTPPGMLASDNAEDNAVVTRAAMDGVFDAQEKPDLHVVGRRMMTRGAKLVAIGRAA